MLISASRRTDIPRYFGRWFAERRRQGFARYRSAFGVEGRVSLRDADVLGYLFWTRDASRFAEQLGDLRACGIPYALQYTIAGHDREVEPHVPSTDHALDDFRRVSSELPSPTCIQWRYDPIVLSSTHAEEKHASRFGEIARALEGYTRVVNTSIVEPYRKAVRRMADPTVRYREVDPERHRAVARSHPDLPQANAGPLLAELKAIATSRGMELRACCNPEQRLPPSQCVGPELFEAWSGPRAEAIGALASAPSRRGCRCLRSVDIGMDETCVAGCKYCYVVTSHRRAVDHYRRHDPTADSLR